MKDRIREMLKFQDLTPEEKEQRGILCRLYGPCADFEAPTRNGRKYSDEVWERVFNENEIVKELLANGGIPGEAQHPADREEVDVEKIALMMPEAPKKGDDGKLIAYFDVQDTPCGRILYQLAKYGFKLGISSRGTGDIITDENGEECVDPSTYDFTCFDAVIIPSVKDARLSMVESLDNRPTLKQALQESLNAATPGDKKIMEETLKDLHIDVTTQESDNIDASEDSKQLKEDLNKEAINDGSDEIIKSLQEAVKEKSMLEKEIKSLQEKLAVSDTKVGELNEELNRYKSTTIRLSNIARNNKKDLEKVGSLEEELKSKDEIISRLKERNSRLLDEATSKRTGLTESLKTKTNEITKLTEDLNTYKEKVNSLENQLKEELSTSSKKIDDLNAKLTKSNQLSEKYKKATYNVVDRYIENKATMLGVKPVEIKNKLSESYTLDEIDRVCEEMQTYSLNIRKLPFALNEGVQIQVKEKKDASFRLPKDKFAGDDDVDESLIKMAGIEK